MEETLTIIALTASGYTATNIDNLIVMVAMIAANASSQKIILVGFVLGSLIALSISFATVIIVDFIAIEYLSLLGFLPIILGVKELLSLSNKPKSSENQPHRAHPPTGLLIAALITLGNSVDTIVVLSPLFAESKQHHYWAIVTGFIVMMIICLWMSIALQQSSVIAKKIHQFGPKLAPFIMIAIGIYILLNTDTDIIPFRL